MLVAKYATSRNLVINRKLQQHPKVNIEYEKNNIIRNKQSCSGSIARCKQCVVYL